MPIMVNRLVVGGQEVQLQAPAPEPEPAAPPPVAPAGFAKIIDSTPPTHELVFASGKDRLVSRRSSIFMVNPTKSINSAYHSDMLTSDKNK